jgi:hypothetical protein
VKIESTVSFILSDIQGYTCLSEVHNEGISINDTHNALVVCECFIMNRLNKSNGNHRHPSQPITRANPSPEPTHHPSHPSPEPKKLGSTNSCYNSLISSPLNKKPTYVVLASNLEDASVSFLHVRALCLVSPQFLQRCRAD